MPEPAALSAADIASLRAELAEAREALDAIRTGEVDALVVSHKGGPERIFTLEGSEFAYRGLVEQMREGAALVNMKGHVLYANRSLANLLKRPLESIIGGDFSQCLLPQDVEPFQLLCSVCLESGSGFDIEYSIQASDGSQIPALLSVTAIKAHGAWTLCVTLLNLTHQKEQAAAKARVERDEALHVSQGRLAAAMNSTSEAVAICDPQGRVLEFNEAFARFHRFQSRVECAGALAGFPDLIDVLMENGDPVPHDQWIASHLRSGGLVSNAEYTLRRRDTGVTWTGSFSLSPIRDLGGRVTGAVVVGRDISEFKRTMDLLRASEQRLRFHFENSPLAVVEWDLDFVVTQWSKEAERMFGWDRDQVLGKRIDTLNLIYPGDLPIVARTMERLMGGQERHVISFNRNLTQAGAVIDCTWHNSVLLDGNGRMSSVMSLVEDITDRKRAEEAVRASEERYRSLFSSLLEGFCILDVVFDEDGHPVDYRFLEVNPAFESLTGLQNAQGKLMHDLAPGHERYWSEIYGKVALTGEPVRFVNEAKALNRWYDVSAYKIGDQGSRKVAVLFNDISNFKRIETQLEHWVEERTNELAHANRLLRVIAACNETIVRTEEEAELVREICRNLVEIGGYRKACLRYIEADGAGVSGSEDGRRCALAGRCLLTGELCRGGHDCMEPELDLWRRPAVEKGTRFSIDFPLVVAGRVAAILEVFSLEVDELQEVETDMLRKLANDLAFGITAIRARRERDQVRAQLEHRTEMLRTLAAELVQTEQRERQRLAKVLHDHLQQLLVAAKWRAGMLAGSSSDEAVLTACEHLVDLLDQAIQSSRDLATELSPAILHESGLVRALEWLAGRMQELHAFKVEIIAHFNPISITNLCKDFLFDAIRELLFNVIKHAGVHQARVRISRSDGHVEVAVEDEGTGFDVEQAKLDPGGTGLGLFSIQERLNYLGGWMRMESTPGLGSQVRLCFPLESAETVLQWPGSSSNPGPAGEDPVPPETPVAHSQKIRLLMVDDHQVVRRGLAGLLKERANIDLVGEAEDGLEAVELAHQLQPEVVLMDINMPGLSGVEATRLIHSSYPDTRIIGLSMHKDEDIAEEMRAAGAVAFVCKSDPLEAILAAIQACHSKGQIAGTGTE